MRLALIRARGAFQPVCDCRWRDAVYDCCRNRSWVRGERGGRHFSKNSGAV